MFIINIDDLNIEFLYVCDKEKANYLLKYGFPVLGIKNNNYYFFKTPRLMSFLNMEGGENDFE